MKSAAEYYDPQDARTTKRYLERHGLEAKAKQKAVSGEHVHKKFH